MKTFKFEFVSISKVVASCEAVSVQVPGVNGPCEILANHAPMMMLLIPGRIRIQTLEGTNELVVEKGILQVHDNRVLVLANRAINSGDVDTDQVTERAEALQALMQKGIGALEMQKIKRKLSYLHEQLKVSSNVSQER